MSFTEMSEKSVPGWRRTVPSWLRRSARRRNGCRKISQEFGSCLPAGPSACLADWLADLRSATVCAPAPPSLTHGVIKLHFWVRRFGVGRMVLTAAVAGPGSERLQRCHALMEGQCRTFTSDRAGTFCLSVDQVVKREGGTWCPLLDPEFW